MLADSALIIAVINTLYYVPLQQVNYVVKACGTSVLISHYNTQQQRSNADLKGGRMDLGSKVR